MSYSQSAAVCGANRRLNDDAHEAQVVHDTITKRRT
jgi:hypothetical protein